MALTISGTSNGKLGNLSLSASTGDILDSANTTFFGTDTWYITADKVQSGGIVTLDANWVRLADNLPTGSTKTGTIGTIGNAMTQSSGNFTFPSTGIWKIEYVAQVENNGSADFVYQTIFHTNDNFSTEGLAMLPGNTQNGSAEQELYNLHFIFDCQDTSTHKVRFGIGSLANGNCVGRTDFMATYVSFTKLGET